MSIQDQYGENLEKTQEAWVAAVESWTTSIKNAFGQTSADNRFGQVEPNAFMVSYFDLAAKTLEAQREVAKNMSQATQSMNEGLRKQTARPSRAARGRQPSRTDRHARHVPDATESGHITWPSPLKAAAKPGIGEAARRSGRHDHRGDC